MEHGSGKGGGLLLILVRAEGKGRVLSADSSLLSPLFSFKVDGGLVAQGRVQPVSAVEASTQVGLVEQPSNTTGAIARPAQQLCRERRARGNGRHALPRCRHCGPGRCLPKDLSGHLDLREGLVECASKHPGQ